MELLVGGLITVLAVAAILWTRVEVRKARDVASSPDPLVPGRAVPPSISPGTHPGWPGLPATDLPFNELPPGGATDSIVEGGSRPPGRPAVADPQNVRRPRPSSRPLGRSGRWGAYRYDPRSISSN